MRKRRHTEVIKSLVALERRRVVDIGCGRGGLARWLARQGAEVLGLDVQEAALAEARAAGIAAAAASATALPLGDASVDVAVVFNSLHHFPEPDRALVEARRVLRPDGTLVVAEPLAQGGYFTFMQPVDDETEVRAEALAAVAGADRLGLALETTVDYAYDVLVESLDRAIADWLGVDPARAPRIEAARSELASRLDRHGVVTDRGHALEQPMRAFLLRPAV